MPHPEPSGPIRPTIMVSTDSTGQGYRLIDNCQFVVNKPIGWVISQAEADNMTPKSKIGMNADVDNVWEDLWSVGGTFAFPSSGKKLEIVSDSTQDAVGGIGARTVLLTYLTSDYLENSTTLNLNGTTVVESAASDIFRVQNLWVLTAGTNNSASGTIDLRSTGDTPIYTRLLTGQTRARNSVYTIPAGQTYYVTQVSYSAGNSANAVFVRFQLLSNYNLLTDTVDDNVFWPYSEISMQSGSFTIPYQIPMVFPEKSDIKVRAIADGLSANAICNVQYRGFLKDD